MPSRRRSLVAPIVVGFALLVAGCGSEAREICGRSGPAELCLVGGPSSYRIEGQGFEPTSDATVSMAGGGEPITIDIDAAGRVATDGASAGVLGGPDPQEVIVTGTTSRGEPAEFRLTVPAVRR
jgi:hypothetical protein